MKCIILAGGFATRLWPLTEKIPKPLVPLAGKPLLSHIAEKVPGDIEIILSVNSALKDHFIEWKNNFVDKKRPINIYIEDAKSEGEKLGALYATSRCIIENKILEDVLILAGDNYFDFSFADFKSAYNHNPLIAVYDIKDKNEASKFGVVIGEKGKVKAFQEKPVSPLSTLVSTGCYIIPYKYLDILCKFAEQNRDNLGGVFEYFLEEGINVDYFSFIGKWFDIGSFHSYINAHKEICGQKILKGQNVQNQNCNFQGSVYLGDNVFVKNSIISDSVILPGARIINAEIRNSVVGKNSTLIDVDLEWKILRDEAFLAV